MAIAPTQASFYADPQSIQSLRQDARAATPESLRETAKQFEGLFTAMMLKSMRDATPKSDLFGSDQQDFYQDMFDQQLSTQISQGKGLGLADMLVQQLMRTAAVAPAANAAAPATPVAAAWPPAGKAEFIAAVRPAAERVGAQLGVDPDALVAQAALETGWGRAVPRNADGSCSWNLFGIKAGASWQGSSTLSATQEFRDGAMRREDARFRSYGSIDECLQDYAALVGSKPRYATALNTGSDVRAFATGLQKGGYATDPDYVNKLAGLAAQLKSGAPGPIAQLGAV